MAKPTVKQILSEKGALKAAYVIATWFGSGLSPKAPGTMGSFCSLPLVFLLAYAGVSGIVLGSLVVFLIGWYATALVLKAQKVNDPGYVVIDETVGQTIAFIGLASSGIVWYNYLIGFILFRFFDIVKIWPASFFDKKVHSAFGVMADDVVAGIYAAVALYFINWFI